MNKKLFVSIAGIAAAVCSAFTLTACDFDNPFAPKPTPGLQHTHSYSEDWSSDATHHWHAATCEHTDEKKDRAEHEFADDKCTVCDYECTGTGAENPPEVEPDVPHACDYENYVCKICDRVDPNAPVTAGLEFEPIEKNGEVIAYMITNCEYDAKVSTLVLPSEHEGKPVTAIGDEAFGDCDRVESITIPKSVTTIGYNAFAPLHAVVNYNGTISEWNAIDKNDRWTGHYDRPEIICTDGVIETDSN